jgi:hypothetical protein
MFWFPGARLRRGKSIIAHNAIGVPVTLALANLVRTIEVGGNACPTDIPRRTGILPVDDARKCGARTAAL